MTDVRFAIAFVFGLALVLIVDLWFVDLFLRASVASRIVAAPLLLVAFPVAGVLFMKLSFWLWRRDD